ncbi:MAG: hypothetical protein L0215_05795 [Gemmataceae bacterium]|nr:hypothetical protein [Gemmataceae bacterium]
MAISATAAYLRIAPPLRQFALYVLIDLPLVGVVFLWFCHVHQLPVSNCGFLIAVLTTLGMTMLLPLRWAVRVDEQGVARRRLLGWDVWPWGEFTSGRIEKRGADLVNPARPCGRRVIQLGFLTPEDLKQALSLINEMYRLPPAPKVPDTLTLQYRIGHAIILDAAGIRLGKRFSVYDQPEVDRSYSWDDVGRVHITRLDPLRRDFTNLEIVLPDEEIEFQRHMHGASREEVNEFLRRHVAPQYIEVDIVGERPARRSDVEKKLAKAIEKQRGPRKMFWILGAVCAGLMLLEVTESPRRALIQAGIYGGFFGPLLWACAWLERKKVAAIREEVAQYDDCPSAVHSAFSR